ncbi:MAG: 30S ribosomal protein S20 [Bdellovibrionales bacterium]
MANHKSAAKRAKQSLVKAASNTATLSSVRTWERKLRKAMDTKNVKEARELLGTVMSKLDKAAKKGVIHTRNASRKISRLSSRLSALEK